MLLFEVVITASGVADMKVHVQGGIGGERRDPGVAILCGACVLLSVVCRLLSVIDGARRKPKCINIGLTRVRRQDLN